MPAEPLELQEEDCSEITELIDPSDEEKINEFQPNTDFPKLISKENEKTRYID